MLLADDKGAELIVAVGTHATLVEFLDKGRAGMASTFLTRLRVGGKLVDAKGVSRLYRTRISNLALRSCCSSGCSALVRRAVVHDGWARPPPGARRPLGRPLVLRRRNLHVIDFRYHLVSIVSIFLALAVGIVLGAGPLKEDLGNTLTSEVKNLRQDKAALRGQLDQAERGTKARDEFTTASNRSLLAGALTGHDGHASSCCPAPTPRSSKSTTETLRRGRGHDRLDDLGPGRLGRPRQGGRCGSPSLSSWPARSGCRSTSRRRPRRHACSPARCSPRRAPARAGATAALEGAAHRRPRSSTAPTPSRAPPSRSSWPGRSPARTPPPAATGPTSAGRPRRRDGLGRRRSRPRRESTAPGATGTASVVTAARDDNDRPRCLTTVDDGELPDGPGECRVRPARAGGRQVGAVRPRRPTPPPRSRSSRPSRPPCAHWRPVPWPGPSPRSARSPAAEPTRPEGAPPGTAPTTPAAPVTLLEGPAYAVGRSGCAPASPAPARPVLAAAGPRPVSAPSTTSRATRSSKGSRATSARSRAARSPPARSRSSASASPASCPAALVDRDLRRSRGPAARPTAVDTARRWRRGRGLGQPAQPARPAPRAGAQGHDPARRAARAAAACGGGRGAPRRAPPSGLLAPGPGRRGDARRHRRQQRRRPARHRAGPAHRPTRPAGPPWPSSPR